MVGGASIIEMISVNIRHATYHTSRVTSYFTAWTPQGTPCVQGIFTELHHTSVVSSITISQWTISRPNGTSQCHTPILLPLFAPSLFLCFNRGKPLPPDLVYTLVTMEHSWHSEPCLSMCEVVALVYTCPNRFTLSASGNVIYKGVMWFMKEQ